MGMSTKNGSTKERFSAISSKKHLASFLGIRYSSLTYRLHVLPDKRKYRKFKISKRKGGKRTILAPRSRIKVLQSKLAAVLKEFYAPPSVVHGFINNRSIKTNAQIHIKQRYVVNLDLKDFFPSINFGRVRGMFLSSPFNFNSEVATALAQICCHSNQLPQGAPSSPIISNIICLKLDILLRNYALENKCFYSRYADDITFSTSLRQLPKNLGKVNKYGQFEINEGIASLINKNGFVINPEKIGIRTKNQQQIVTGLVVNINTNVKRKYYRQVRAMLNAWDKYGLQNAQSEYYLKYDKKNRNPDGVVPEFRSIVTGKVHYLGYIRKKGKEHDKVYYKLSSKLKKLIKEEESIPIYEDSATNDCPLIITEGHTDWKHLKKALEKLKEKGLFENLELQFWEYGPTVNFGDTILEKFCLRESKKAKNRKYICLFDRDNPAITKKMVHSNHGYKFWGNQVYSCCIPVPFHRKDYKNISIEFFYSDEDLKTKDSTTGKRLFFSNELEIRSVKNPTTNKNSTQIVVLPEANSKDEYQKKVFDNPVNLIVDGNNNKIAHSKSVFAANVLGSKNGFAKMDFSHFESIFSIIESISKLPKGVS